MRPPVPRAAVRDGGVRAPGRGRLPPVVDDRLIGASGLSFASEQRFDDAQMEFLEAVAGQCAQALDRAWFYTAEVGTRYLAAGEGTTVGGDLFDVFALDPGSWAVVVGDVCSKGR